MGCAGSKLDDLQAVVRCRERSQLLEAAISHRYSLAHAHLCYLHSLRSVAASLHRFLDLDALPHSPPSPFLPLPTHRKGDPSPGPDPDLDLIKPKASSAASAAAPTADHHHSHSPAPSNSGSHLHFYSDSDSDSDISTFHQEGQGQSPPRYYMNYARSGGPAPSVTVEQRPETVPFAGSYAPYSAYPYPYPQPYAGVGSFFGVPPPDTYSASPSRYPAASPEPERGFPSSSQAPPPPPPPPSVESAWYFLNPFESTASYYPPYTPSRDSTEVREKEGIPDLEDEVYQQEVVKEAYEEQKFVFSAGRSSGSGKEENVGGGEVVFGMRSTGAGESSGMDVHLVDKNVVEKEEPLAKLRSNVAQFKARGPLGVVEAVSEIKAQFDRASESGGDVSKILEVGKLPYRGKKAVYKVSSKMLDVITPLTLQSSISKATEVLPSVGNADSLSVDFEEDMRMKSRGLSSTLEKLYIWETKLYEEVKVEEKIRIALERKCRRLQHLDERGAETHKIEATRIMVRDLSAKMRIALHFVDSISHRISKLRDEDLWPQIELLIQGFVKMWKVMLECHHSQCLIVMEAKNLDVVATDRKLNDAHMEATMQLEQELLNWILSFYAWINAQKSYIKALNGWLMLWIQYEPEVTADGPVPFSPGRIGAPPVFVISNHWSQVMDRISENEVYEAMQSFSMSVLNLWDKYNLEQRQRMMANKDMDKRVRLLEREEQNMQKALDVVNKKLTLVSEQNGVPPPEHIVHQSHGTHAGSIQSGLKQTLEAMERFSDVCKKAYEELHARCDEDRPSRENVKVP